MKALNEILQGREENHILPFYWQHGDHTDRIPAQIAEIYTSGCRALCVESRPHKDFAGPGWWRDMDVILREASERDMKVWILDDDHFPTGHANGIIGKKYPHLKPRYLVESHADVIGPQPDAALLCRRYQPQDTPLCVTAYRQTPDGKGFESDPLLLTDRFDGGVLRWDIPEGVYRIFFTLVSCAGAPDYIDFLRPESCRAMLEAVYEPHYERYKDYFGNTIAGFFSDEPQFKNPYFDSSQPSHGFYNKTVGMPGLALPWTEELVPLMEDTLGYSPLPYLTSLWYELDNAPELRFAYMDAVSKLYSRNFTGLLGEWCEARGVMYIGHVIEDMNNSTRLGYGAGHFFRAQKGQHMAGMDVVLHQIIPGFAHNRYTGSFSGGEGDPAFFHYVLTKLAASMSHITPEMRGRAMCEVFGAYGWAEGTRTMKWLMDHLLVRGINYFVPHAFTCTFPDPDCPPHFGCEGHDPQFEGFTALMKYVNRVSHLFEGAAHRATAALLYHAEGEWMSGTERMYVQEIAVPLYDRNIDYDIIPADALDAASVEGGRLRVSSEGYDCLIVPWAKRLPVKLLERLAELSGAGLTVIFAGGRPDGAPSDGNSVVLSPGELPDYLISRGMYDITVGATGGYLRHYHASKDGCELFMFFNESLTETVDAEVATGCAGPCAKLDLFAENYYSVSAADGKLRLKLPPYCSEIYVFGAGADFGPEPAAQVLRPLGLEYDIWTASYLSLGDWEFCRRGKLFNILAPSEKPDFGGKIKYETSFTLTADEVSSKPRLDLGHVCECASVKVNGVDCGIRICPPYVYDIGGAARPGENTLEIVAATNLGMALKKPCDNLSTKLVVPPSGVLGPVTLETE